MKNIVIKSKVKMLFLLLIVLMICMSCTSTKIKTSVLEEKEGVNVQENIISDSQNIEEAVEGDEDLTPPDQTTTPLPENSIETKEEESDKETCFDTDANNHDESDPNSNTVKGTTTGLWNNDFTPDSKFMGSDKPWPASIEDWCLGDDQWQAGKLLETYCARDGVPTGIVVACKDGQYCTNGACRECVGSKCPSCYDSDGGIDGSNFAGLGTVTGLNSDGVFVTRSDNCENNGGTALQGNVIVGASVVQEYFCDNGQIDYTFIECAYGCNTGGCMNKEEADGWIKE